MYYPAFDDINELLHHYHAAKYFVPRNKEGGILFLVSDNIKNIPVQGDSLPVPEYFGDYSRNGNSTIKIIRTNRENGFFKSIWKYRASKVFIWKSDFLSKRFIDGRTIVDLDRNRTASGCFNYPRIRFLIKDIKRVQKQRGYFHNKFNLYIDSLPDYSKAFVFGTGPSVTGAFEHDFSDGYRIICNTLIKNKELMKHIKPNFLAALDGIYHFGISKYACQFREDLEVFIQENKCMVLVPEDEYSNFIYYYSKYRDFILPVSYDTQDINLDMKKVFQTKGVPNVLNRLLLPLSSSLSNEIYFLGFDGRKNNDLHFWSSSEKINYEDLKVYHQMAHPGFFRYTDYLKYAETQSELSEIIISLGEKVGKKYYSLNESTNTAFKKRYIHNQ